MNLGFLAGFSFKTGALYQYLNLPPIIVVAMLTIFYLIDASYVDSIPCISARLTYSSCDILALKTGRGPA